MASQSAIKLPKRLPTLDKVSELFCELIRRPISGLYEDLSILDLFKIVNCDITRAWLTGSQAWNIAVYGKLAANDRDVDLIFADKGEALNFIGTVYKNLNNYKTLYTLTENNVNGHKLRDAMTGRGLLDVWDLASGQSIAEHLCGYQWEHERVAIPIATSAREITQITRIISPDRFAQRPKDRTQRERPEVDYDYGS